jgi:hypothetical protein
MLSDHPLAAFRREQLVANKVANKLLKLNSFNLSWRSPERAWRQAESPGNWDNNPTIPAALEPKRTTCKRRLCSAADQALR